MPRQNKKIYKSLSIGFKQLPQLRPNKNNLKNEFDSDDDNFDISSFDKSRYLGIKFFRKEE